MKTPTYVSWQCSNPRCKKTAMALPDYLIRCTCGTITRSDPL